MFLSKCAFKAYSKKLGVDIQHYHCDNGRFSDNLFMRDVIDEGQSMSQCGVNAHFQNGIAEKRIRDLQDHARRSLIHAKIRWSEVITANLWPYAIRNANDDICTIPDKMDGTSKLERFTKSRVSFRLRNKHTLFCPVFALNNSLQQGRKIEKWSPRARLGINLGASPRHARNVSLVLNLKTGLVSPQFHILHDDFLRLLENTQPMEYHHHFGKQSLDLKRQERFYKSRNMMIYSTLQ